MESRRLGSTDLQVGVLGFGAAEIGFELASVATAKRLLNAALDSGLNVIDTAECYLASELLIGETVGHRREQFHLFTKCGHPEKPDVGDWRPESLLKSVQRSLKRLRTDRVDLLQLHTCSEGELRKGDVIAALRTAKEKGYTRYIGYSGDGSAARFSVECGAFDVLQTSVSLLDQEAIGLFLPLAVERGMGVIAKRPIANVVWRFPDGPTNPYLRPYGERMKTLDYAFLKGDTHAGVGVALRFALAVPGVHTAIVGTARPERWHENLRLLDAGPLPGDEFSAIRERWLAVAEASWHGRT